MHSVWRSAGFPYLQAATACIGGTLLIASGIGVEPDRAGSAQVVEVAQELIEVSSDLGAGWSSNAPADQNALLFERDEVRLDEVLKERQTATETGTAAKSYCPVAATAAPDSTGRRYGDLDPQELSAAPLAPAQSLPPDIGAVVDDAAGAGGLDQSLMRTIAYLESSGNPTNITGSYKGLFQLSASEFQKYGGGNIFDPRDNARAAAFKLGDEIAGFGEQYGRDPTPTEIYMTHQQGIGGLANHLANPNGLAWQNMASTAEGRQKGALWARAAIWRNVPEDVKWQFVSVDNLTSAQFIEVWRRRVEGWRKGQAIPGKGSLPGLLSLLSAIGCAPARRACRAAGSARGCSPDLIGGVRACWGSQCAARTPSLQRLARALLAKSRAATPIPAL